MSANVRPFHVVGAHALGSLELRVHEGLLAWRQGWLPAGAPEPALELRALLTVDDLAGGWVLHAGDGGRVWFHTGAVQERSLASALLGMVAPGVLDEVLQQVVGKACAQRNSAVAQALIGPHADPVMAPPDAALAAPGSGAVCLRAPALGLWAVADAGALRHVPPLEAARKPSSALVPLERTLGRAPLRLDVTLGSVELELGPLLELQPGDVIRLPARLADNLTVEAAGQRLAGGRLGTLDGHRAVQIVAERDAGSTKR